jgi:hypothetical protein
MGDPIQPNIKKPFSKLKLIWYGILLVGLMGACLEGYWAYFKLKIWMSGFGVGIFWAFGLIGGFIYFYVVHKFHVELKALSQGFKKAVLYAVFVLGLLILDPIPLSMALWLFTPPGSINTAALWFFVGSSFGGGIVLLLERLFAKKSKVSV